MDAGSLVVLPGQVPENRLISAGKSHKKPSEEISLLVTSLTLEMRKVNFSSLKKFKPLSPASLESSQSPAKGTAGTGERRQLLSLELTMSVKNANNLG